MVAQLTVLELAPSTDQIYGTGGLHHRQGMPSGDLFEIVSLEGIMIMPIV